MCSICYITYVIYVLICKRLCKTTSGRDICVSKMMLDELNTKIWYLVSIGKENSPNGGHSQRFII